MGDAMFSRRPRPPGHRRVLLFRRRRDLEVVDLGSAKKARSADHRAGRGCGRPYLQRRARARALLSVRSTQARPVLRGRQHAGQALRTAGPGRLGRRLPVQDGRQTQRLPGRLGTEDAARVLQRGLRQFPRPAQPGVQRQPQAPHGGGGAKDVPAQELDQSTDPQSDPGDGRRQRGADLRGRGRPAEATS